MIHEPKLSAYIIKLNPKGTENTNRNLFKHIIGEASTQGLSDSFIFLELCKKFVQSIDTDEMYSDSATNKCFTANQINIQDENVNTNIRFHSEQFIIEGIIEGGSYGKKRKKTSTSNKKLKDIVSEEDAITDDFYFLIHLPLNSSKAILLVQSYSDDSIDSVVKRFWKNFLKFSTKFNKPTIYKHVPAKIIEDFKNSATVSNLVYTTDMPGETLLQNVSSTEDRLFKVSIKIEPSAQGFTIDEFDNVIAALEETEFKSKKLSFFRKKQGTLKDNTNGKTTPFELENDFNIKPSIPLSKYITINNDEGDFERIKDYCFKILEDLKQEVYIHNAVQER